MRRSFRRARTFLAIAALAACGCRERGTADLGPLAADTVGDTIVLHTQDTGVWEAERTLEPDLVIGAEGDPKVAFGFVTDVAVAPDGRIYVAADQRAVLRFSRRGKLEAIVGRRGEGPGEYSLPQSVTVSRDGAVLVGDATQRRVVEFGPDDEFVRNWPRMDGQVGPGGPMIDTSGALVTTLGFPGSTPRAQRRVGFVRYDSSGTVLDTIPPPTVAGEEAPVQEEFAARKHIAWHPFGFLVAGVSSDYVFDLRRPDHTIRVRRPYEAVPVSAGERSSARVRLDMMRRRGWPESALPPMPPDDKAAFRHILPAETGDVWLILHGKGEVRDTVHYAGLTYVRWDELFVADVFSVDGRYRGRVRGPFGVEPMVIRGDTVWAVAPGKVGEATVVRYLVR